MMPLILLALLAIPIASLALLLLLGEKKSRPISVASTLLGFAIVSYIFVESVISGALSLSVTYPYISALGINFGLRINLISMVLLLMSSAVLFATALAGNPEKEKGKARNALVLLFQTAAMGIFMSSNMFLFFIFWDVGVIAMFFMINLLGSANRKQASMRFIVYEIFASSLLFLGIMLLYFYMPGHSLDMSSIVLHSASMPVLIQELVFLLLFVAFMVNMPMFPMHFWLPDAHTEAPTQGSMLLSGVLTKFGGFGMLLIFYMLPISSKYAFYVAALAVVSAFYSVLVLMKQTDIKRIIAYSTIIEMSVIMVGIAASNTLGTYGAVYAMLSHGLTIALMFLVVGSMKHIFGERSINVLKGTVASAASTSYSFLMGSLSMVGFPLTAGFVADILLFIGSASAFGIVGLLPLVALMLMAMFMYFVMERSVFSVREKSKPVDFITIEQKLGYAIFLSMIFIFGVLPFTVLGLLR